MWYMNRFWTLHLVLNGHLYKYTVEPRFYDPLRFNDIPDWTVSTDFCAPVKVTVNRFYYGFRRHFDEQATAWEITVFVRQSNAVKKMF